MAEGEGGGGVCVVGVRVEAAPPLSSILERLLTRETPFKVGEALHVVSAVCACSQLRMTSTTGYPMVWSVLNTLMLK